MTTNPMNDNVLGGMAKAYALAMSHADGHTNATNINTGMYAYMREVYNMNKRMAHGFVIALQALAMDNK